MFYYYDVIRVEIKKRNKPVEFNNHIFFFYYFMISCHMQRKFLPSEIIGDCVKCNEVVEIIDQGEGISAYSMKKQLKLNSLE